MCPNCRAFITSDDKICPYCQAQVGERIIDRRSPSDVLGGLIPHQRFVTMLILLINTGLYVATMLRTNQDGRQRIRGSQWPDAGGIRLQVRALYLFPAGEWWRLITAGFLHGGLLHILMNSWVLFDLGPQVNQAFGTPRFLVHLFRLHGDGLLGQPVLISSEFDRRVRGDMRIDRCDDCVRHTRPFGIGSPSRRQYIQWVVYLLIFGLVIPNVDNYAHLGGLAGGFVIGYLAGTPGFSEAKENFWRLAAGLSLAATGWAFFEMFMHLTSTSLSKTIPRLFPCYADWCPLKSGRSSGS